MTDLNNRLRNFIDTGVAPVSAEEIFLASAAVQMKSKAGRVRPRLRRRLLVLSGMTAIAAAVAIVSTGLVTIPGTKNTGVAPASAAVFLKAVASEAASQKALIPEPGQYLYVATVEGMGNGMTMPPGKMFWYDADELVQSWTSPSTKGHQTWQVVGRPRFVSAADRATWVADGSKPLESGNSSGGPPAYYNVAGLPTKASAMVAYFKTQTDLPAESIYGSWPLWEFDMALGFLQNGASSAQRAALLRFVATIQGVRLMGHATSIVTGQTGSVIAMGPSKRGWTQEAIFNPSTSSLIEIRIVLAALPPKTTTTVPQPTPFIGETLTYTDFLFAGITHGNSTYSLPTGTPKFPQAWPSGSVREPLPGWLGSPTTSAAAATVSTCSSGALTVELGTRGHAGASSAGFAIAVTNQGTASCSLNGFATVAALTKTASAKPITFVHSSQSQTYATALPKTIVLAPKKTASFGISYTDSKDQQYGNATGCQMYAINVRLPGVKPSHTTRIPLASIDGPTQNYVNACFTNFRFGLTPIVTGSNPPQP
jgi:hypothetical protein